MPNLKRLRLLLIPVAFIFLAVGTVSTFAYWYTTSSRNNVSIEVGTKTMVEVETGSQTSGVLVPKNCAIRTNEVEAVNLTYYVSLSQKETISRPLDFHVYYEDVLIGDDPANANYVVIDVNAPTTIQNETVMVVLTVSLNEPETQEIADSLYGQIISFNVVFEASI